MAFLRNLFRTLVCLSAAWLAANLILIAVVFLHGVSIREAMAWPYETGKVTLTCWFLLAIPLAAADQRRSWFQKWWTASLFGGMLGVGSFAIFMHWFFHLNPEGFAVWIFIIAMYAIAFAIGAIALGLYYRSPSRIRTP